MGHAEFKDNAPMADSKKTSSAQKRKMLQFVNTPRDMPAKRDADVRNEDFLEIYGDYIDAMGSL